MVGRQSAENGYSARREESLKLYEKAKEVIPGGVAANIKYFSPYPIFMKKGNGSYLIDVDDHKYIDYLLCYGSLILGHGHKKVMEAVWKQMAANGTTIFGSPHELEIDMAEKFVQLFPGIEMARFTNSGLEATLLSIRLAQGYTGKRKIAKFEGHYHGAYNKVLISVNPKIEEAGNEKEPISVKDSLGVMDDHLQNTIVLPFNDLEATEHILRTHKDSLAAVILEPVQGGFIPAEQTFLEGLRKITADLDILLIFDEVKTGFRITLGGAQNYYKVIPDITALGKVIGGGFPIGAVGGKKEIMEMMAPDRGRDILTAGSKGNNKDDVLFHSGTYNGHPTVLAAGMATIEVLEEENVLQHIINKTEKLRKGLENLYRIYGIPMQTVGLGSIFNIIFSDEKIKNYRDVLKTDLELRKKLDYELLNLGVYTKPLNRYSLSAAHSDEDISYTIEAHEQAIKRVRGHGKKYGRGISNNSK